ncbi:hypothetical protein GYO_4416 [Bacillus spizizenii TU-B-10]|uniref:Uncharacterized protein n=1 Tax=Bacillus spizizenii (strain DSM 15029 / JCM 12233 / NBRC 101239 / NRRL B-23049 / TU-B-10) TaxID=1052585 RepID=G4NZ10_BACS4|nr:hypothetical protein GYO_4416 [Bacillus spizizenii TU-B-10]
MQYFWNKKESRKLPIWQYCGFLVLVADKVIKRAESGSCT